MTDSPFNWKVPAGRALEAALNRAIALDPETRAALGPLQGRSVELAVEAPPLALRLQVEGERLTVVWELELGRMLFTSDAFPDPRVMLEKLGRFDDPRRLDAFLHAVRWGAVASAFCISMPSWPSKAAATSFT